MKEDYDTLDRFFCAAPLLGKILKRVYAYFKKHTAITDAMHVSLGLGVGLLIAGWFYVGMALLGMGLLGHLYAFIEGGKLEH